MFPSYRTLGALLCALVVASPALAGQVGGSSDSFFMGNEAAIVGGAGLAITTDGGSAWVNPAGLALIPGDSLSLSASAFTVRRRAVENIYSVKLDVEGQDPVTFSSNLDSTEIMSIPSTIVRVWRLAEGLGLGLGFFTPRSDVFSSRHNLDAIDGSYDGTFTQFSEGTEVTQLVQRYQLGPSVGWAYSPNLRLGASLHILYERQLRTWKGIHMESQGSNQDAAYGNMAAEDRAVEALIGGVQASVGFQATLPHDVRLGAVIRSPVVQLFRKETVSALESYLNVDGEAIEFDFAPEDVPPSTGGARVLEPFRTHVGVAFPWSTGWLAVDVDVAPPFEDEANGVSFPLVWNVRAGVRLKFGRQIRLGFGLFTDHSRYPEPEDFLAARIDFYGVTAGVQHLTRFQLGETEESERLVLMSTLGLKYAMGLGKVMGEHLRPLADDPEDIFKTQLHDAMFHETSLHIGTGILF
jgi:hypothetical protein